MSTDKIRVVIPPEVLEQMERDIPPDELQSLLDEFQRMADSGELFENSQELDMEALQRDDPELYQQLTAAMQEQGFDNIDDWTESIHDSNKPTLN